MAAEPDYKQNPWSIELWPFACCDICHSFLIKSFGLLPSFIASERFLSCEAREDFSAPASELFSTGEVMAAAVASYN